MAAQAKDDVPQHEYRLRIYRADIDDVSQPNGAGQARCQASPEPAGSRRFLPPSRAASFYTTTRKLERGVSVARGVREFTIVDPLVFLPK